MAGTAGQARGDGDSLARFEVRSGGWADLVYHADAFVADNNILGCLVGGRLGEDVEVGAADPTGVYCYQDIVLALYLRDGALFGAQFAVSGKHRDLHGSGGSIHYFT